MPITMTNRHDDDCACCWCVEDAEVLCPTHLHEVCSYCADDYGRITCHHPDHEDYCPEDSRHD